jgi:hypothetical protein
MRDTVENLKSNTILRMKWFLKTSPLRIKKPFEILILKIPKPETAN